MNSTYIIIVSLCAALLAGCTEQLNLEEFASRPVVEAFLFAGQPIDSIEVRLSQSYANQDSVETRLSDLDIVLEEGENSSVLENSEGYFKLPLVVKADQVYSLRFEYENQTVSAETYVPPSFSASIETNRLALQRIDLSGGPGGLGQINFPDPVEITWDNSTSEHYYVSIVYIEEEANPVIIRNGEGPQPRPRMTTEPEVIDNYIINPRVDLTDFGTYQIVIYRVGPEYVSLFESTGTTSISLNDPPTNINNGLGIFAGISTDTIYLEVEPL